MPLKRIRAATLFQHPIREVLHRLKYEGYHALADPLAELMANGWARWQFSFDLVVPVPLHRERERQRGFNQAGLLVQALARKLGWTGDHNAMWRTRATRPQVGLSPGQRRANVEGAFRGDEARLGGRHILLVDDVYTTGATLNAAAEAALAAGAASVSAYCLTTVSAGSKNRDV